MSEFSGMEFNRQLLFCWTMQLKGSTSLTSGGIGTQSRRLRQLLLQLQEELVQRRQPIARTNLAPLFPPFSFSPPPPSGLRTVAQF